MTFIFIIDILVLRAGYRSPLPRTLPFRQAGASRGQIKQKVILMDMQLLLVLLCVAAAFFFIVWRFRRALRKGQCSCGCEGGGDKKNCCAGGCSGRKLQ